MNPTLDAMQLELGSRVMGALMLERTQPLAAVSNRYRSKHPPIPVEVQSYRHSGNKLSGKDFIDEVVRIHGDLYWVERLSKKGNLVCTSLEGYKAGETKVFRTNEVTSIITQALTYNTIGGL